MSWFLMMILCDVCDPMRSDGRDAYDDDGNRHVGAFSPGSVS